MTSASNSRALVPILSAILFLSGCVLVGAAYWAGLKGPLLLDDFGSLANVVNWLDGDRSWPSVVFGNHSGVGGRSMAMASFVLDAAWWGKDVWHFKLTNLLLHLACGAALLALYARLMRRDPDLGRHAAWLPILLALTWMALPIHVSSVLYVVQRMAILSALFTLLALWLFVAARERIERGQAGGVAGLWLGVPVLAALAFLSKENGALVPLLALVIEVAYFRPQSAQRRPRPVSLFFAIVVVVPVLLAGIALALHPQVLLSGYSLRDFSPMERLLTQPRILWNYVTAILLPDAPRLSIFHDNYPKSTGWLSPWTTMPAILGWLVVVASAWHVRKLHPAIIAGTLLFLVGHAMESTIWPLELYFEHRNYLPSVGVLLAVAGLIDAIAQRLTAPTRLFRIAMPVVGALMLLVYLATTHGRARVWSSLGTFYAQEMRYNRDSPRLRSFLAVESMEAGQLPAALAHIEVAEQNSPPDSRMTHSLWRVLAYCEAKTTPPDALYLELEARAHGRILGYAMTAWELVVERAEGGSCPGLDVRRLTDIGLAWTLHNPLPAAYPESWNTRYNLARLLASQSRLSEAAILGARAWRDSNHNNKVGIFLFQINASLGRTGMCRDILATLKQSEGDGDYRFDTVIHTFEQSLSSGNAGSTPAVDPPFDNVRAPVDRP